jgi:hypothetical protein
MSMAYLFTKPKIVASVAAKQKIRHDVYRCHAHYVTSSALHVDTSYSLEWLNMCTIRRDLYILFLQKLVSAL